MKTKNKPVFYSGSSALSRRQSRSTGLWKLYFGGWNHGTYGSNGKKT